jgi:hypothetical protein
MRIKKGSNNQNIDTRFYKPNNPVFNDQFFNGKSFEFWFENPRTTYDKTLSDNIRGLYKTGDSVLIKFSSIDKNSYLYYSNKYTQMNTGGSPFSSPINLPSNVSNGALGVFSGFSTTYKLLICK